MHRSSSSTLAAAAILAAAVTTSQMDTPVPDFYDPYDDAFLANPWPVYQRMRDEAPAYFVEHLNTWAFSRFEDVLAASMDRTHYTATAGTTLDALQTEGPKPSAFVFMDPPQHTYHRNVLNPLYQKASVALLEDKIRKLTRTLMAPDLARGELEIYGLATQVGLCTIADLIGLRHTDIAHIRGLLDIWMHREPATRGVTPLGMKAFGEVYEYIMVLVREYRVSPPATNTHLDAWMNFSIDGRQMSDDEIFFSIFSLVVTGSDTISLTAAGTVYYLGQNPQQYAEVRADHGLIPHAFAETARYDQPTNILGRRVVRDLELHGQTIKAGQNVLFLFASANRDDREFQNADQYQISRRAPRTLAFGAGIHGCLGQHLGRLEGKIVLEEVFAAIPEYEVQTQRSRRTYTEFLQGYCHVPITFRAR